MILGLPLAEEHNPLVDWTNGTLTWKTNSITRKILSLLNKKADNGQQKMTLKELDNEMITHLNSPEKETIPRSSTPSDECYWYERNTRKN
jgi:hypothetical protein